MSKVQTRRCLSLTAQGYATLTLLANIAGRARAELVEEWITHCAESRGVTPIDRATALAGRPVKPVRRPKESTAKPKGVGGVYSW